MFKETEFEGKVKMLIYTTLVLFDDDLIEYWKIYSMKSVFLLRHGFTCFSLFLSVGCMRVRKTSDKQISDNDGYDIYSWSSLQYFVIISHSGQNWITILVVCTTCYEGLLLLKQSCVNHANLQDVMMHMYLKQKDKMLENSTSLFRGYLPHLQPKN